MLLLLQAQKQQDIKTVVEVEQKERIKQLRTMCSEGVIPMIF